MTLIFPHKNEGHSNFEFDKYLRFIDTSLETVQSSRLSLYSSKYSKHVYTQHQLLVLVLLKEYISTDYRDFVELIDLMSDIKEKLDLDKIPHFTTLQNLYLEFLLSCSTFFFKDSNVLLTWRKGLHCGD